MTKRMTKAEYAELFEAQGGKCAICRSQQANGDRLCIDHVHEEWLEERWRLPTAAATRLLLCRRCNAALGLLFEDYEIMHGLIQYVAFWREDKHALEAAKPGGRVKKYKEFQDLREKVKQQRSAEFKEVRTLAKEREPPRAAPSRVLTKAMFNVQFGLAPVGWKEEYLRCLKEQQDREWEEDLAKFKEQLNREWEAETSQEKGAPGCT